ncbi:MAG: sigma-70 family RNA polymerase sigma factor [Ruminococcus sp.]|nr:sigma-70 family RNA polymerase sigma factor [Ruminococcus sp.]
MTDFAADTKLAQQGDTAAFARLYETVYQDLYHTAYYSLRNHEHDAADAVSETVMEAFASIKNLKNPEAFRSWIFRILSAKIKRKQRDYYRQQEELTAHAVSEDFSYAPSELREVLQTLSDTDRLILSLSVLSGYTSEEIGRICDMQPGTVRSRLSRMKAVLRVQLQD